jgi:hypothetical protein
MEGMRAGIRSWLGRAALLVLLPALVAAGGWRERDLDLDSHAERELVELTNQSRKEAGLPKLEQNDQLREAARTHALEMARRGQVTHRLSGEPDLRQRVAVTGLRFDLVAENVGRSGDVDSLHQGFLRSPAHRENILDPEANAIGVGAVRIGRELFVTENFAHVVPDYEPDEVEKRVAQGIEELRKRARLPRLSRGDSQLLREQACDMARRNSVQFDHAAYPAARGTLQSMAYATADPAPLPEPLRQVATGPRAVRFAVGACTARSASYPAGGYWIVVVFYSQ